MSDESEGVFELPMTITSASSGTIQFYPEPAFDGVKLFGAAVKAAFEHGPADRTELLGTIARSMGSALFSAVEALVDKDQAVEGHRIILAEFLDAYDVSMTAKGRDLRMSKTIARLREGTARAAARGA